MQVPYPHSLDQLMAALESIDFLVRFHLWHAQNEPNVTEHPKGLYITQESLERLFQVPLGAPAWAVTPSKYSSEDFQAAWQQRQMELHQNTQESLAAGVELRLPHLAITYDLDPLEVTILLICLAPELEKRYQDSYAFLQDDLTHKRPTMNLLLQLLNGLFDAGFSTRLQLHHYFLPQSPLLKHRLIRLLPDAHSQHLPKISQMLQIDDRVVNYLLGTDTIEDQLIPYVEVVQQPDQSWTTLIYPSEWKNRLWQVFENIRNKGLLPLIYLQGPEGVGKQTVAEALCCQLEKPLLIVDGKRLQELSLSTFREYLMLIHREAQLQKAAVFWREFNGYLSEGKQTFREWILSTWAERNEWVFLSGESVWEPSASEITQANAHQCFYRFAVPSPTAEERASLWHQLRADGLSYVQDMDVNALAGKFNLRGGQIQAAINTAHHLTQWEHPGQRPLSEAALTQASRLHSHVHLGNFARKIEPRYAWNDLVLPEANQELLEELRNTVKHKATVYEDLGFGQKMSLGKGLSALFSGLPGTGKTMAAEVLAHSFGLDLYQIDLSQVVSKYIGETEKNLSQIFQEAESSNAILFFDEADALFGKRSAVKDAHDRNANIEVSYLLQRVESYSGIVILATNFRGNLDEAFIRRFHYCVDFPLPEAPEREQIWQKVWPNPSILSTDVDLEGLAHNLDLTGGNIRNIALASAFQAAEVVPKNQKPQVSLIHIIHATQREKQKMGQLLRPSEMEWINRVL